MAEKLREKSHGSVLDGGELHDLEVTTTTIDAIAKGTPLRLQPINVVHFNSLQVRSAERFVFGSTDDFSLVTEMVAGDASMQRGPRFVEATGKF